MKKKKLENMRSGEVLEFIRDRIREMHGDEFENECNAYCSHGYYYVDLPDGSALTLRRWQIKDALKSLVKK